MGSRPHLGLIFCRNFVAILPYRYTLYISLRLIIPKILRVKSSLFSLLPLYCVDIIALCYKKLDIGNWSTMYPPLVFLIRGYNL